MVNKDNPVISVIMGIYNEKEKIMLYRLLILYLNKVMRISNISYVMMDLKKNFICGYKNL